MKHIERFEAWLMGNPLRGIIAAFILNIIGWAIVFGLARLAW
jgi:hypothetical protein